MPDHRPWLAKLGSVRQAFLLYHIHLYKFCQNCALVQQVSDLILKTVKTGGLSWQRKNMILYRLCHINYDIYVFLVRLSCTRYSDSTVSTTESRSLTLQNHDPQVEGLKIESRIIMTCINSSACLVANYTWSWNTQIQHVHCQCQLTSNEILWHSFQGNHGIVCLNTQDNTPILFEISGLILCLRPANETSLQSNADRWCSNYIWVINNFILHSRLSTWLQWIGLRQLQTIRATFKFWDFVQLILQVLH